MINLAFAASDVDVIRAELVGKDVEGCAILFTNQTRTSDGTLRLLVREIQFPLQSDYSKRGPLEAELLPEFVARITKKAKKEKYGITFVHSHPGDESPLFSLIDDEGEKRLAAFLLHRHPDVPHLALVVSKGGMRARRMGTGEGVRIVSIGTVRQVIFEPSRTTPSVESEVFDRQVRAFGAAGQQALQQLRIAIVGVGGIGSLVAQQLVHLGVRDFILIDPDTLESTNLNRVANATPSDLGKPKVDIAERYIQSFAKNACITCVNGDIIYARTARALLDADIIFCCTDSHGSRSVIQQVSYQYLIPCIDTGTTIAVENGRITHIIGRVQWLSPGYACLVCSGLLNSDEVRRDMMTAFERQADPYFIQGGHEPAPAVMSLNSTVASLAVTMLLSIVSGVPVGARYVLYNALTSTLRNVRGIPNNDCYICSRKGSLARGDSWPLLARQD